MAATCRTCDHIQRTSCEQVFWRCAWHCEHRHGLVNRCHVQPDAPACEHYRARFYAEPCPEMDALAEELVLRGVPIRLLRGPEQGLVGWQLGYATPQAYVLVSWTIFGMGHERGLLEATQVCPPGETLGYLTAGDVLRVWPAEGASL